MKRTLVTDIGSSKGYHRVYQFELCLQVHITMTSSGAISSASIVSMAPDQEDWGPGPPVPASQGPPPEFRIPPPPLPSFMLPDDLDHEDFCQTTRLETHLDVCDTTFVS